MKKTSKTVLYKNKMLMNFFIATMIIVVSIPAVVSDPPEPETGECMGSISPNNVIPTTPGFRYDPDEYIVVTGEICASAEVHWAMGLESLDDWDCALFDAEYPLQKYGPNVISDSEFVFGHAKNALDCGAWLVANASMGAGYAISASVRSIRFSATSISNSVAAGCDPCHDWGGGATANEYFNRPLHVRFPFSVSESGILFVEEANLILSGGASGYAEGGLYSSWSYDCDVHASWEIIGEEFTAGDTYSLSDFGSTDDYDGLREIPLPAGDYIFDASYDSYLHGGISVRGAINSPASAWVNALSSGRFDVTLNYLPEE